MEWLKKILVASLSRLIQPSSLAGIIAAGLTYLNWNVSAEGQVAMVQFVAAAAAVALIFINEKPWGSKK